MINIMSFTFWLNVLHMYIFISIYNKFLCVCQDFAQVHQYRSLNRITEYQCLVLVMLHLLSMSEILPRYVFMQGHWDMFHLGS